MISHIVYVISSTDLKCHGICFIAVKAASLKDWRGHKFGIFDGKYMYLMLVISYMEAILENREYHETDFSFFFSFYISLLRWLKKS